LAASPPWAVYFAASRLCYETAGAGNASMSFDYRTLRNDHQSASLRFVLPSSFDIGEWHALGIDAEVSAGGMRQYLLADRARKGVLEFVVRRSEPNGSVSAELG
jgi:hypothetical protein